MDRINGAGHVGHLFVTEDAATNRPPTEITDDWLNNVQEELCAVVEGSGAALDSANRSQVLSAIHLIVNQAVAEAVSALPTTPPATAAEKIPTGFAGFHRRHSAPPGWVELKAGTIGNGTSGATVRANADTADLFALIWSESDNVAAPIQDSNGAASVRGASAAVDFAAGKRLPLDEMRGEFFRALDNGRGIDPGRVLGSWVGGQNAAHTHVATAANAVTGGVEFALNPTPNILGNGGDVIRYYETGGAVPTHTHAITVEPSGGSEALVRSRAYLACIKL